MHHIAAWWDQLELWVAGLPFAAQLPAVLAMLLPLSFGLACAFDWALTVAGRIVHIDHDKGAPDRGSAPVRGE